jgi:hypothetical protein
VYLFLRKCVSTFVNDSRQKTPPKSNGPSPATVLETKHKKDNECFWASVLFCVHPIHAEPLGGLVGRADLLSALVFLLAYILISDVPSLKTTIQLTLVGIVGSLFKENTIVIIVSCKSCNLYRIFHY